MSPGEGRFQNTPLRNATTSGSGIPGFQGRIVLCINTMRLASGAMGALLALIALLLGLTTPLLPCAASASADEEVVSHADSEYSFDSSSPAYPPDTYFPASLLPTVFPFNLSSLPRVYSYMAFVSRLTLNVTIRNLLLKNPANLPPSLWRALATTLGDQLDGLPPPYAPSAPLETPEQAIALQIERVAAASDNRFALLRAQQHRDRSNSFGDRDASDHSDMSLNKGFITPAALQRLTNAPQRLGSESFAPQVANGGYVYGYRVTTAVEMIPKGSSTVDVYRYYGA